MLPAAHRLTDPDTFRRVQRRGRRSASRTLVTHTAFADLEPGRPPQVGLVVAKAVGNAVARNAVKRRLRHLAGQRLADLPEGSVWVLRALPSAAGASSAELGHDLDRCLRRTMGPPQRGRGQVAR